MMSTGVKTFLKSEKINCFICNSSLTNISKNAFDIFKETENGSIVIHLEAILNQTISSSNIHSQFICRSCMNLCREFEEISHRLDEIRNEIIINYNNGITALNNDSVMLEIIKQENIANQSENEFSEIVGEDDESSQVISISESTNSSHNLMIKSNKVLLVNVKNTASVENAQILDAVSSVNDANVINQSTDLITLQQEDAKYFDENDANMVEICTENNFEDFLDEQTIETIVDENGLTYDADGEILAIENEIETIDYDDAEQDQEEEEDEEETKSIKDKTDKDIKLKPIFLRSGTNFICQLCPNDVENLFDVTSIAAHLKSQHQERVHICDICGADFRKRNELNEHLDEHNIKQEGDFQCDICNRIFNNLRLYRVHKRMHTTKVKSWTCEECNKKYSSKNLLDEHMNMHTGDRPYKCQHCSKDFASKYTLTAHLKIHTDRKRPFQCATCSKSFFSIQNLTQHERTHSGVKEFVCNICSKAFGTLHNLDVHKIVHTGYKPFICRTCGKAFARRAEIKDHERTHTGEKPYNCDICGANFAQRSNLMSHKRATHLNDKRYKCDVCEKSFKRRRLLDYHKKATHTGERPYKCEACLSTFVYPEHYKKHLRIHTGVKPFKCEVCGKAFNSRDNRNAHRFVHSEKKPYECVFCGQGFMRKPLLLAHMEQQNHKNEVIITNHAQISVSMANAVEYLENNDEKVEKLSTSYLNDDDPLDGEIIEEQHIIEEDDSELIIDGQVQFSDGSQEPTDQKYIVDTNLCETIPESVFITEETELVEEDDEDEQLEIHSENDDGQLMQVQIRTKENTSWINVVSR